MNENLLEVDDVYKFFRIPGGILTAVNNVSFSIDNGEVIALVGETGSGKTTLGRMTAGLELPSKGKIIFNGKDMKSYKSKDLWRNVQYIHQDPYASMDPLITVYNLLARPLKYLLNINNRNEEKERITEILERSGLDISYIDKKGGELSGGERQRVLIARAFISSPNYVVIDEPTTMIDFIHRNEIIETINNFRNEMGTSMLLITHDISLPSIVAQKIIIFYHGEIVEMGSIDEIYNNPLHPYTTFLIGIKPANLRANNDNNRTIDLLLDYGSKKNIINYSDKACPYSYICPIASERCRTEKPELLNVGSNHYVACFKPGEFNI